VGSEGLIRGGPAFQSNELPPVDAVGNTGEQTGKLRLSCFGKIRRIFLPDVAADLRHYHSGGEK